MSGKVCLFYQGIHGSLHFKCLLSRVIFHVNEGAELSRLKWKCQFRENTQQEKYFITYKPLSSAPEIHNLFCHL